MRTIISPPQSEAETILHHGRLVYLLLQLKENPTTILKLPPHYLTMAHRWYQLVQQHPGIGLTALIENWDRAEIISEIDKELS